MAYIGREPTVGNFQVCDAISVVNNQAAYTMQVGGVNVSPETANHMLVSLNGVLQAPGSSFTVSGSTITFASNLVTGDVINFIHILWSVLDLGVPSDSTVSLAKLTATGTKSSSTFLRGDNTFDTPPLGGITSVTTFRLTANLTGGSDATISANLSAVSSPSGYGQIGSQVTQSSGIFTFPATGIWSIEAFGVFINVAGDTSCEIKTQVTTDNSSYNDAAACVFGENDSDSNRGTVFSKFIFDVTDTSTHKCLFRQVSFAGGTSLQGDSNANRTYFIFTRLGDT